MPDAGPIAGPERYLLIKAWRQGFWSDVDHLLGQLLIAELTGRVPVTHWGVTFRYTDDPTTDAFRSFFDPVSDLTLADMKDVASPYFPPYWTPETLSLEIDRGEAAPTTFVSGLQFFRRVEKLVVSDYMTRVHDIRPWIPPAHALAGLCVKDLYRHLIGKWLRPSREIRETIDDFVAQTLPPGPPTLAVHYRGTDKRREYRGLGELDYLTDIKIAEFLRRYEDGRVFVLTDDSGYLAKLCSFYPGKIVAQDCERGTGDTGLHFRDRTSRRQLGIEVMIDTYAALTADEFVGTGPSNLSAMIEVLKPWPPGTCELLLPSALEHPNLTIYDDRNIARKYTPGRSVTITADQKICEKAKRRWQAAGG